MTRHLLPLPRRAVRRALPALVAVLLAASAAPGAEVEPPPAPGLIVEAPAELAAYARRLEDFDERRLTGAMRLAGLDEPGAPIRVVLVPEGAETARRAPPWVAGYAVGAAGPVVLFPARANAYPYDSFEELVQHEVAHVLVERAARGAPVPRWLHEGIAMTAGEAWGLEDRTRFAIAAARRERVPLDRLDRRFGGGAADAATAYAVAGGFVNFLLRRHGPAVTGDVLAGLARGLDVEAAFREASGESLAAAEAAFWKRTTLWHRWVPLLTSSTALWIGVTLLVLWAVRRRRAKSAAIEERWAREEAWLRAEPARGEGGAEIPPGADRVH